MCSSGRVSLRSPFPRPLRGLGAAEHSVRPSMRAALEFFRNFPEIRRQTADVAWPLKLQLWLAAYDMYRRNEKDNEIRTSRKRVGEPAARASCCGRRPDAYSEGHAVKDIPELNKILTAAEPTPRLNQYYDCTACGQEWQEQIRQWGMSANITVKKA